MEKSFFPSVFRPVSPYILSLFFYIFFTPFFSCFFSCFFISFSRNVFRAFLLPGPRRLAIGSSPAGYNFAGLARYNIFICYCEIFLHKSLKKNFLFFLLRRTSFFMLFLLPSAHTLVKIFYTLFTIGYHNLKFLVKTTFYCVFSRLKKKFSTPLFLIIF